MSKPFVFYPEGNPQQGENHRTVTIRHNGSSVSIKCSSRSKADALGKALVGVFNRYLVSDGIATRTHTCSQCGNVWDSAVTLGPTANLSGEATAFCPGCGGKSVSSSEVFERNNEGSES